MAGTKTVNSDASSQSPSLYTNFGADTKENIKASKAQVKGLIFTSVNAGLRYLQLFNKATAPIAGTDVPLFSFKVPAGAATSPAYLTLDITAFGGQGSNLFSAGLSWAVSTTQGSFTDSATASDHDLHLQYN